MTVCRAYLGYQPLLRRRMGSLWIREPGNMGCGHVGVLEINMGRLFMAKMFSIPQTHSDKTANKKQLKDLWKLPLSTIIPFMYMFPLKAHRNSTS